ncbi:ATP-binding protein [Pseudomonas sp. PCH446]
MSCTADQEILCISIEDSGKGIGLEQQKTLFAPFVQVRSQTDDEYGGTGLGLSICKQLVELMGGSIVLLSQPGEGTRVRIELALKPVELAPTVLPVAEGSRPRLASLKVLIVDDLSANCLVLNQQLRFLGQQVVACESGEAALQAWNRTVRPGDYRLQYAGHERLCAGRAIRRIEAGEQRPPCPVVGCTANAMSDERQRCWRRG